MAVKAQSTISLASVKTVNDSAVYAREKALEAEASAQDAKDALQSVVQGATTVEKAVSVMQTALEAVVDYDPDTDTTTEYFWHDANGAHVLGDVSGYRNDIDSTGMHIVDISTENPVAEFGASGAVVGLADSSHVTIDADSIDLNQGTVEMAQLGLANIGLVADSVSYRPHNQWTHTLDSTPIDGTRIAVMAYISAYTWVYASFIAGTASTDGYISYDGSSTLTCSGSATVTSVTISSIEYMTESVGNSGYLKIGTRNEYYPYFPNNTITAGEGLSSSADNSIVLGAWNDPQGGVIEVGNGTGDGIDSTVSYRKTTFRVMPEGDVYSDGNITDGSGNVLANKPNLSTYSLTDSSAVNSTYTNTGHSINITFVKIGYIVVATGYLTTGSNIIDWSAYPNTPIFALPDGYKTSVENIFWVNSGAGDTFYKMFCDSSSYVYAREQLSANTQYTINMVYRCTTA